MVDFGRWEICENVLGSGSKCAREVFQTPSDSRKSFLFSFGAKYTVYVFDKEILKKAQRACGLQEGEQLVKAECDVRRRKIVERYRADRGSESLSRCKVQQILFEQSNLMTFSLPGVITRQTIAKNLAKLRVDLNKRQMIVRLQHPHEILGQRSGSGANLENALGRRAVHSALKQSSREKATARDDRTGPIEVLYRFFNELKRHRLRLCTASASGNKSAGERALLQRAT